MCTCLSTSCFKYRLDLGALALYARFMNAPHLTGSHWWVASQDDSCIYLFPTDTGYSPSSICCTFSHSIPDEYIILMYMSLCIPWPPNKVINPLLISSRRGQCDHTYIHTYCIHNADGPTSQLSTCCNVKDGFYCMATHYLSRMHRMNITLVSFQLLLHATMQYSNENVAWHARFKSKYV